jgi:hypothetical protein
MTDVLDLSDTLPSETVSLNLLNPRTKQKSGWVVELAGPQHPLTLALVAEVGREGIERSRLIESAQVNGKTFIPEEVSLDERRRKNVNRVCRRIVGWSPNPVFKNISPNPLAFSLSAATDLFLRPEMAPWFLQITEYLNSEQAFMQPSGTT